MKTKRQVSFFQANLTIQEAKLNVAQNDLNEAQAQLDEKQAELDKVQAMYDKAVQEKQVKVVEQRLSLFQGTIFKRVTDTGLEKIVNSIWSFWQGALIFHACRGPLLARLC